ncbi:hypothetical protein CRM22_007130 [Opisthorchis felineus]|uniref:TIP41-like protein n=2 Tax=Opisthorchis felineus TaxID=147828 RepID=A0A4S2LHD8_OPIFE|nr:hypothetical protein CRM22_007130 [Opisthorchis felineus]
MESPVTLASPDPNVSEYSFDCWHIALVEHHILKSVGPEREAFERQLRLPNLPEMIFDKNRLCVDYKAGLRPRCAIQFTALDALQLVDAEQISIQVPIARAWREARANAEEQLDHPKPYDWTFTTLYTGTLLGEWTVEPYEPGLDLALLQRRDPILFYAETTLYEDELGDNGVAMLHLKLRAMNTGFFLLQRFFLRVDGGLVRVYDTRLQWRKGDSYLIREVKRSQSSSWGPAMTGVTLMAADSFCDQILEKRTEKLTPTIS